MTDRFLFERERHNFDAWWTSTVVTRVPLDWYVAKTFHQSGGALVNPNFAVALTSLFVPDEDHATDPAAFRSLHERAIT